MLVDSISIGLSAVGFPFNTGDMSKMSGSPPVRRAQNLAECASALPGYWQPTHVRTIDESHSLKVAKIKGEFIWHSHPATDETFICVSGGPFRLELSVGATSPEQAEQIGVTEIVELGVGDLYCVDKGVQHRPVAEVETGILMIEKVGTVNTGDREGDERTVYVNESTK